MFGTKMLYGAAYYPEHWERKHWARDAKLMKQAGFNVVRVGEFAWWNFEPREGVFDFTWLDDAIAGLYENGISTIIGTPTATIPAWMAKAYPHVMGMDDKGVRRPFGVRKDYCVLQPDFDRLAMRVVERVAAHYADDKRVIGFQTDNEFGSSRCRCGLCHEHFRKFLQRRYGTIDRINKEYGTWFWGAVYNSFDEIDLPTPACPNPSHGLDFKRFASFVDIEHQSKQIKLLRKLAPRKLITHNLMGLFSDIEYYEFCKDLDFVSWDSYPGNNTENRFADDSLAHAVMWSMKQANVLIMEKQSGPGGWTTYAPATAPGEQSMLAWQSIARGADGISYFRWRTSISGQEQYWHGIINHDNVPRRRYREVATMGKDVARLSSAIIGTEPVRQVGIYNNYDQIWATEYQHQNNDDPIRFNLVMREMAEALLLLGVDIGSFGDGQKLKDYKALVCPPLYLSNPKLVADLTAYVRAGGHLVLTARSGVKTINNKNLMQPLPGPFAELAGVEIDEYAVLPKDADWKVELPQGSIKTKRIREHLLVKKGTEIIGIYRGDYMDGLPAITKHKVGKGCVWYVGTLPSAADWRLLFQLILPGAKVDFRTDIPTGIEIAHRSAKGRQLTFVLNHAGKSQIVRLAGTATDLLGGKKCDGRVELPPYGVAVLNGRA